MNASTLETCPAWCTRVTCQEWETELRDGTPVRFHSSPVLGTVPRSPGQWPGEHRAMPRDLEVTLSVCELLTDDGLLAEPPVVNVWGMEDEPQLSPDEARGLAPLLQRAAQVAEQGA